MLDDPARRREAYLTFIERIDVFPERIIIKLRVPGKERTLPSGSIGAYASHKEELITFTREVPLPLPRRAGWLLERTRQQK